MLILSIVFWLAVAAGGLVLTAHWFRQLYAASPRPDAVHFLETEDGACVIASRYLSRQPLPGASPVVLCPPAWSSGVIFDVDLDCSLARFLADQGYDVWIFEPRGRSGLVGLRNQKALKRDWAFDDYVNHDLRALLPAVLSLSGADQVHWVGFGAGGLIPLVASPGDAGKRVASATVVGGATYFRRQQTSFSAKLVRALCHVRLDLLARVFAPLVGRVRLGPLKELANFDNVDSQRLRRALVSGLVPMSKTELLQYAEWLEHDSFTARALRRDYREVLEAAEIPALLISGSQDTFAPADSVEATRELLAANTDCTWVVASRANGMSANYGHLDLLLGRRSEREVFPVIVEWLDRLGGFERPDPSRAVKRRAPAPASADGAPAADDAPAQPEHEQAAHPEADDERQPPKEQRGPVDAARDGQATSAAPPVSTGLAEEEPATVQPIQKGD